MSFTDRPQSEQIAMDLISHPVTRMAVPSRRSGASMELITFPLVREFFGLKISARRDIAARYDLIHIADRLIPTDLERHKAWLIRAKELGIIERIAIDVHKAYEKQESEL